MKDRNMHRTKLRVGDTVKVVSGGSSAKGVVGKILAIDHLNGRVKVDGAAKFKKHLAPQKSQRNPEGGVVEGFGYVHISNVMLFSSDLNRPTRLGYAFEGSEKIRVARGSSNNQLKV